MTGLSLSDGNGAHAGDVADATVAKTPIHASFFCTVFWNGHDDLVIVNPRQHHRRVSVILNSLNYVAQAKSERLKPKDVFQRSVDWLQFSIVQELAEQFSTNWSTQVEYSTGSGGYVDATTKTIARPNEPRTILTAPQIMTTMSDNMFFRTSRVVPMQLALPPGTNLTVQCYANSNIAAVSFTNAKAFIVRILISPTAGGGQLLNYDPAKFGLTAAQHQQQGIHAYPLLVDIDVNFQPLASSTDANEYHNWANEVVKVLQAAFADPE